jgi:hypothetical protein
MPDIFFNLGIALAYFALPFLVYRLIRLSPLMPFRSVMWMFMVFILACGTSHITKVLTEIYGGVFYLLDLFACGVTFTSSIMTALLLLKHGKRMFGLIQNLLELDT